MVQLAMKPNLNLEKQIKRFPDIFHRDIIFVFDISPRTDVEQEMTQKHTHLYYSILWVLHVLRTLIILVWL